MLLEIHGVFMDFDVVITPFPKKLRAGLAAIQSLLQFGGDLLEPREVALATSFQGKNTIQHHPAFLGVSSNDYVEKLM